MNELQIPRQLNADYLKNIRSVLGVPTREDVGGMMALSDYAALPVVGDCMEGAGIEDGGYVAVCFKRFPRPPMYKRRDGFDQSDACLCWLTRGRSYAAIKQYDGVWGTMQMVGTRYKQYEDRDFQMNWSAPADRIYGVIFAAWDPAGKLQWMRDLDDFPNTLGTVPRIHGENFGTPRMLSTRKEGASI